MISLKFLLGRSHFSVMISGVLMESMVCVVRDFFKVISIIRNNAHHILMYPNAQKYIKETYGSVYVLYFLVVKWYKDGSIRPSENFAVTKISISIDKILNTFLLKLGYMIRTLQLRGFLILCVIASLLSENDARPELFIILRS